MKRHTFQELIKPWLTILESIDLKIQEGDSRKELIDVRHSCIAQINKILNPKYVNPIPDFKYVGEGLENFNLQSVYQQEGFIESHFEKK